ncbi:MAG: hypothetical protein OXI73_10860 [Rhodospirillales bacterium]|nr:hypothetical protein [Rhodospirillales bacterium]
MEKLFLLVGFEGANTIATAMMWDWIDSWPLWVKIAAMVFLYVGTPCLIYHRELAARIARLTRGTANHGDGEIRPIDTIHEHGIITKGATGYPEKLTTWEQLREGKSAPPPAPPPKNRT